MTNEELVALIQAGDREKLTELWERVEKLVWKKSVRWAAAVGRQSGAEAEDFHQAAFLAFLEAVRTFDPEAGAPFVPWFLTQMKTEFSAAAGIRTKRAAADPLRGAASLDAPASPEASEGFSLVDLIVDPAAEAAFEENGQRTAVEEVLATLPENQREAIRARFWYDSPSCDRVALAAALRLLRHPSRSGRLKGLL